MTKEETISEEAPGFRQQFENLAIGWQLCETNIRNLREAQHSILMDLTELMRSHGIDSQVMRHPQEHGPDLKIEATCRPRRSYLKSEMYRAMQEIMGPEDFDRITSAPKPPTPGLLIPAVKRFIKETGRDDVQAALDEFTRYDEDAPAQVKVSTF